MSKSGAVGLWLRLSGLGECMGGIEDSCFSLYKIADDFGCGADVFCVEVVRML
jgi:hypothetical protein